MVKLHSGFLTDKDILFVGYSSRNIGYSRELLKAFTNNRIKVYPYNTKENAKFDIKVYQNLSELPVMPKTAFILLNKDNTSKAVKELIGKGFKKILFHSQKTVDPAALAECDKAGIETAYGCPMMIFGTGFHKFHAFIAGVK
ncbi:MAG TPA: CoA-binding protein [Mobilitalea sp.]|nr:CoA-binding protein [Mobilitalea sp.]